MLRINVSLADASVTEKETLTAGRVGLECAFTFSGEWADLQKVAVFDGTVARDVLMTADTVRVPGECMASAGYTLRVGVYGMNEAGGIVIPTVWAKVGKIAEAASPTSDPAEEITPSLAAQVISTAENALEIARGLREDADNGAFIGPQGPQGVQGPVGPRYELTEEDKEDIAERAITFCTQAEYDALSPEQKASGTYWITDDQPSEPISIASIVQTQESREPGGVNELTITRTDGVQSRFTVRNGTLGPAGEDGDRLPAGGTPGQVLTKQSATDGDTVWGDALAILDWGQFTAPIGKAETDSITRVFAAASDAQRNALLAVIQTHSHFYISGTLQEDANTRMFFRMSIAEWCKPNGKTRFHVSDGVYYRPSSDLVPRRLYLGIWATQNNERTPPTFYVAVCEDQIDYVALKNRPFYRDALPTELKPSNQNAVSVDGTLRFDGLQFGFQKMNGSVPTTYSGLAVTVGSERLVFDTSTSSMLAALQAEGPVYYHRAKGKNDSIEYTAYCRNGRILALVTNAAFDSTSGGEWKYPTEKLVHYTGSESSVSVEYSFPGPGMYLICGEYSAAETWSRPLGLSSSQSIKFDPIVDFKALDPAFYPLEEGIISSPNGVKFRLSVDDSGNLTTEAYTE